MRKIVYTAMCLLCVFTLTGCSALAMFGCESCFSKFVPSVSCDMTFEDTSIMNGDFKYYVGKDDETGEEYARIVYVTNIHKKDVLVIPEKLDGYRVRYLSRDQRDLYGVKVRVDFGAGGYKKVHIPNTVEEMGEDTWSHACRTLDEYILNADDRAGKNYEYFFNEMWGGIKRVIKVYLPDVGLLLNRWGYYGIIPLKANLQYSYNVDEISKRHWIDNVAVGSLLTPPPTEPTRQGYIFDGWYKETECISLWDFETDVTQTMEIEEGQEITEEMQSSENYMTMLYAKWIKE